MCRINDCNDRDGCDDAHYSCPDKKKGCYKRVVGFIPKENMIVGKWYVCNAINFSVGRWTGNSFEYIRTKWGDKFLDKEFHWDDGAPHGTAKPYKLIDNDIRFVYHDPRS